MFRKLVLSVAFCATLIVQSAYAAGTVFEKEQQSYLLSQDGYLTLVMQFALVLSFEERCKIKIKQSVVDEFQKYIILKDDANFIPDVFNQKDVILDAMKNNQGFCQRWEKNHREKGIID